MLHVLCEMDHPLYAVQGRALLYSMPYYSIHSMQLKSLIDCDVGSVFLLHIYL